MKLDFSRPIEIMPLHELVTELNKRYQEHTVVEISPDLRYYAAADYENNDGSVFVFRQHPDGLYHINEELKADKYRKETGFGIELCFSNDAAILAVMSESSVETQYGKTRLVTCPVSVFRVFQIGDTTRYSRISFCYPRFVERDSDYGAAMVLSDDGQFLFVSSPRKTNDRTTPCEGATGGIYTFKFEAHKNAFIQNQVIRPPFKGVEEFGCLLSFSGDSLFAEDNKGNVYRYKIEETRGYFPRTWMYQKDDLKVLDED